MVLLCTCLLEGWGELKAERGHNYIVRREEESCNSTFLVSSMERALQSSLLLSGLVVCGVQGSFALLQGCLC